MSPVACQPEVLEAHVLDRLNPQRAAELQAHLLGCPRCTHELQWLRSEHGLFAQRARRTDVSAETLWSAIEAKVGPAAAPSKPQQRQTPQEPSRWTRIGFALAAACLLFFTLGPREAGPARTGPTGASVTESSWGGFSIDPSWSVEERYSACLVATPSNGLPCSELNRVPASFSE